MRQWARRVLTAAAVAALVAIMTVSGAAGAAPTDADKARARALLNEGYDLMEQGTPKAAIDKFREADGLVHYPITGLSLGRALNASGLLLEASAVLHKTIDDPPKPGEPAPFAQARIDAQDLARKVDAAIPTLVVSVVKAPDDVHVSLDGQPLALVLLGTKMKVNPGAHVVTATGAGVEKRVDIALREGEFNEASLDFSPALPQPGPVVPVPRHEEHPDHSPSTRSGTPWLAWTGFGVGVVGVGVGSVTGALAFGDRSSALNDGCTGGKCPPSAQSAEHGMQTMATISTLAFSVGAAGVVVGIVGLLFPSKASDAQAASARSPSILDRAHLVVGPGTLGVAGEL
jgi:hypothetical protein